MSDLPEWVPPTFEEMFTLIFEEAHELMVRKQRDYGSGNIAAFGELGCLVRVNDKLERLKHLHSTGHAATNEAVDDSWADLLNYCAIALAVRRGWWTQEHCPLLADDA